MTESHRFVREGSLYLLMGALLLGVLWSGGYWERPKWTLAVLLLSAAAWELFILMVLGEGRLPRSPALWGFVPFAAVAAAGLFWSAAPEQTGREVLLMCGYLSALFVARRQVDRMGRAAAARLLGWLVYTAAFAGAWGIATYLMRINPYATLVDGFLRAGSTFEYSNALSCFELMALPVTLALHQEGRPGDRPLFATAAALETAAVVLSFSRLGAVALGAVAIYFLITARRRGLLPETVLTLLAGALISVAALVLGEAEYGKTGVAAVAALALLFYAVHGFAGTDRGRPVIRKAASGIVAIGAAAAGVLVAASDRAQSILYQRFGEGFSLQKLFPHRQDTWSAAWQAFRDRPVRGWGFGSFAEIFPRYQTAHFTRFAHNVVLQAAVETGIIGAGLFVIFLGYVLVLGAWRLLGRSDLTGRALAIAALVFLFYNMFDWEWYIPAITAWFMVVVACLEVGPEESYRRR